MKVDTGAKVKGWVVSLLGGYNVRNTERLSVDVIAGARYLDLSLDFDLGLQSQRFGRPIDVSASEGYCPLPEGPLCELEQSFNCSHGSALIGTC